jgi:hypothetical protein
VKPNTESAIPKLSLGVLVHRMGESDTSHERGSPIERTLTVQIHGLG